MLPSLKTGSFKIPPGTAVQAGGWVIHWVKAYSSPAWRDHPIRIGTQPETHVSTFTFLCSQKILPLAQNLFPPNLKLGTICSVSAFSFQHGFFDIGLLSLASPSTNHFLHLSNYSGHKNACPPCFSFQHWTWCDSALNHVAACQLLGLKVNFSLPFPSFDFTFLIGNDHSWNDGSGAFFLQTPTLSITD